MVRVIVDNYPLPSNPIFAKAVLNNDEPGWIRLDTAYRKGSMAYLEFGTRDDLTRPLDDKPKEKGKDTPKAKLRDGRSFFSAETVVSHNTKEPPKELPIALLPLLDGPAPKSVAELGARYEAVLKDAVAAWREDRLSEAQRAFLDDLIRHEVLPVALPQLPELKPLVAEYRRLEAGIPVPQRAPGVLETAAYDAPFFPRGDHLKPGEAVARGYLEVIDSKPYPTKLSGRLELAADIANPSNPLTARVTVNRIWHWMFGKGIVPTVDNFGRLGEKPTHPDLLDFLAARFVEQGWSIKEMVAYLATARAFQIDGAPSAKSGEVDPANELLSHFRVHRIEAESVRDSLLAVAGSLDARMGGPSDDDSARRSIYLRVRRTGLNPFLQVFDAPKPFTTLGRRDATNVPAQSLTMLNSPFVIAQSTRWAKALVKDESATSEARVRRMFAIAFGHGPDDHELEMATRYLALLAEDRKIPPDQVLASEPIWQDFAQSLFNLKEFIYVR